MGAFAQNSLKEEKEMDTKTFLTTALVLAILVGGLAFLESQGIIPAGDAWDVRMGRTYEVTGLAFPASLDVMEYSDGQVGGNLRLSLPEGIIVLSISKEVVGDRFGVTSSIQTRRIRAFI